MFYFLKYSICYIAKFNNVVLFQRHTVYRESLAGGEEVGELTRFEHLVKKSLAN